MSRFASRSEALHRVAEWYTRNGFGTRLNDEEHPGAVLDCGGRLLRPPLVVMEGQRYVRFVDVETTESLGEGAAGRWRASLGGGLPLHVYVPATAYERAWALRTEANLIEVRLVPYEEECGGVETRHAAQRRAI